MTARPPTTALSDMTINVSGVGTATTNASGDFTLTYGGTDSKTITAAFLGPWVNVNRASGTDASHSGTITPGTPYTIDWTERQLPGQRARWLRLRQQDPRLDQDDRPDLHRPGLHDDLRYRGHHGYCPGNAWWDGTNINFCAQATSYGNTARMGDVVYHEYTHGITRRHVWLQPRGDDVHEGNSDIGANLLTRESIMGLGFYLNNCTSGIRNSAEHPPDPCSDEVHICGQVIAGFYWDSWQALLAAYPQAVRRQRCHSHLALRPQVGPAARHGRPGPLRLRRR